MDPERAMVLNFVGSLVSSGGFHDKNRMGCGGSIPRWHVVWSDNSSHPSCSIPVSVSQKAIELTAISLR